MRLKTMRLFVAVPVPEKIKERIAELGKEIIGDSANGIVPVKPQNMHLTLKFIGETDESNVKELEQKLSNVQAPKFNCKLRGVGVFPNESYVRVVWVGVESNNALECLAKKIMDALKGCEGHGQDEEFSAHLTIARVKKKLDVRAFLQKHKNEEFGSFEVSEFYLMQSVLKPSGPEYKVIATFKLN
jgi:2'-5' RNA ligase